MSLLSKDAILAAADFPAEVVNVPEWGGSVKVRGLSAAELDAFEESRYTRKRGKVRLNLANTRARLCAKCIVGEDGQPMFTEADVAKLGAKSGRALDRVYSAAARLSGIGTDDLEDEEKNSETIPPAA